VSFLSFKLSIKLCFFLYSVAANENLDVGGEDGAFLAPEGADLDDGRRSTGIPEGGSVLC
jgi:hypothetical protein